MELQTGAHDLLSAATATSSSSWKRPVLPEASQAPPDVMLHVGSCMFALHEEVLQLRWPWLYVQLRKLREDKEPSTKSSSLQFNLQLKATDAKDQKETSCPLQTITLLKPLLYTRCLAAIHQRVRIEDEDSSSDEGQELPDIERRRGIKRRRNMETNDGNRGLGNKRARKLFGENVERTDVMMVGKSRKVAHVEVVGATAIAVIPVIEYVYTFRVRLLHETSALQTLQFSQGVGMGDRIRYSCLKVAARQVTLETWMELIVSTARLTREDMRRNLCIRLVDFLYDLQPVQYQEAMDKLQTTWISVIDDHDMLVRVVVALINNVRLTGFWRNLLDGLVKWIKRKFELPQVPSLRTMHQHFVTDWEPYMELSRVECFTNTSSANSVPLHVDLFEFGNFVLQACINATGASQLLWRVIRRTSSQFFSEDPEVVHGIAALENDPTFWIRGQLLVKYQPVNLDGVVVTEETQIIYQHCRDQYCEWKTLVSPTPSTSLPTTSVRDEGWVNYEDPTHNYYRRTVCTVSGKLFLWGDPICSLYHQLLQTTLFCNAPNVGTDDADILIMSEMQQLPVETLVLVLCSDRLRIPEGERMLLRCLNKMVFGLDVYDLRTEGQLPRLHSGRVEDVTRLYRCIRWCFVPLDDIIQTLRWAPRTLKLYEIIVESLRDPNRFCKRRRPFGWRKYRDAYMTNETNLSEFEIEAGDLGLAPTSHVLR